MAAMSAWQAAALFGGVPLAVVALVVVAVYAVERRPGRRAPFRGVLDVTGQGIRPNTRVCAITRDAQGRETHHDAPTAAAVRADAACWTARCPVCGQDYREGGSEVHFATSAEAVTVLRARGWSPTAAGLRCPACQDA